MIYLRIVKTSQELEMNVGKLEYWLLGKGWK